MKKLIVLAIVLLATTAMAQDQAPPTIEWKDIPGGRYQVQGNSILCQMNEPVMTDLFSTYGRAVAKGGEIVVLLDKENKTVPKWRDVRAKILLLKHPNHLNKFQVVTLQFQNQIRIERKDDRDLWEVLVKDDLWPIFEEAAKPQSE